ncbi:SMC5-SMC6 complex localization factor protein 2-like isoform X3, partial [Lates japonicus]
MRKATENQGDTRALAEYFSPRNKVKDLALQQHSLPPFTSFYPETPMKPSQVHNRLSHPPPRRVLPLQSPELCHRDRLGPPQHPSHPMGPIHSPEYILCSPANVGTPSNRSYQMPRDRLGLPQYSTQPSGPFSSHLVPVSKSGVDTSVNRLQPLPPGVFHHAPPQLMKDLSNSTPSFQVRGDQVTEPTHTLSYSGSKNVTAEGEESNKAQSSNVRMSVPTVQLHRPPVNPSLNNRAPQEVYPRPLPDSEHCSTGNSYWTPRGYQPPPSTQSSDRSSGSGLSTMYSPVASCQDQQHRETPSSEKLIPAVDLNCPSQKRHREFEDCDDSAKKLCLEGANSGKSLTPKPTVCNSISQRDTSSLPHVQLGRRHSDHTHRSTSALPVKIPSRGNQVVECRKMDSNTPKSTSKPNSGSLSSRMIERNKTAHPRRPVIIPDDVDELFTPDPMTYVVNPAHKSAKPKVDEGTIKSPTAERSCSSSTVTTSSTVVTGSSCHKTQSSTVAGSSHAVDTKASSSALSPQVLLPTVALEWVKLGNAMPVCSKYKELKNSPITSSARRLKEDSVKSDEKRTSPLPINVTLETDAAAEEQTSTSHCSQSPPLERQASEGGEKQVNEEDPIDVELDLGLSFALDFDLTQSSQSSEEEQLLSLQEMMERATKPPDTPEKGAFSEPSTPGHRSSQLKTQPLPSTTKPGLYKNNLDQMLKEINTNKKAKEVETQLLTACKEDLLRIAEYEEAEENQEEGISTEQQEFLQRYSLMSNAIREVPPGEVVFNLEKFGRIFNQNTLQLRQCMVNPQGTAQKTLLWSSPAQLRLHVNIGLFQEAYNCCSPCPIQVTRFLFKMMSVHSERMISEKILQALCDIACSAAYQMVKNGSQRFKVWVPSLADVTLVLMNMGVAFVTLFPFENLQPPFTEGDLLEDIYIKSDSPSSDKEQSTFPEHNCNNILKYLSYCMDLCPRAYSDNELLLLLTVVGRLGLDTRLILRSCVELYPLQYKIVNNIRDWGTMLPRICVALSDLTDDHHNMCLLVQLLPDNTRGKQLRRHLSLSMISKLLDGNCTYRPTEKEFQLSTLRQYLPRMQPSTLLRGMVSSSSSSQKDKEDIATLDQQSYYLCYSLLTLANEASNFQFFPAHQKEQLLCLCSELETHVKCDIRESEKCLYRSKVKDLVARIYTKWQMLLQRTRPLHGKLYDYWQPLHVDTLISSQEEQDMDNSDEGEGTVMEENPVMEEDELEEETNEAEENEGLMIAEDNEEEKEEDDMKLDEKLGETGVDDPEAAEPVPGELSQEMPEMEPEVHEESQVMDEQIDAEIVKMSGLPEGMTNGPSRSEHLEKDAQIWERPWTLGEMRQSSANWSLAADSGLFLFLQDFSHRMLSKTHEIEKQLDSLIRDTKATDSCLHSVFNDFLMLSNTQFIENRVYDEEVEDAIPKADALEKQPEQEKTREQKEAELIPKMQEAVNYGLRVLESAFEHLDIKAGNSDSEDEEVTDRVEAILEPKDLYVDRPLPYLIGSQAFMEQDDVGLGDLSSDEMSVDSDRDSVIESEDGKEAVHSDDDFNQDEDEVHNNIKTKSSMLSYDDDDEEEDEDSDIFGESDKDDDVDTQNTGPSSFADELAARIKGEPVNKPEADRASLTSKKKSKGRKEPKPSKSQAADDDSDDMFKPPKMDEDDFSPFGGKSGLFSGGKGLFDDDDEGDLFSEAPKPSVSEEKKAMTESTKSTAQTAETGKPGKKIPTGAISIFPDNSLFSSGNDSDSVRSKENGTPVPKTNAASKSVPSGAGIGGGGGGLFDDDDEDDDFFSGKSLKKSDSAGKEKPKPKRAVDLFDEDDEDGDIFSDKYSVPTPTQSKKEVVEEQAKPPEKKMPAGAISMFGPGTKSLLSEGLKKRQPSTSEESEKSEENGPAPDVGKAAVKQTQKPQSRGLFSDDEDTQIFPTIPKSQSKPEPTSQSKTSKAPLSLFDDEEEEDLFASAAKSKPKPNQAKVSTPQPSKTVSSSLFSDDE